MISCFAAMGIVSGIRMRPKPVKKRRRSGKRTA
jgi:hypothetical protein